MFQSFSVIFRHILRFFGVISIITYKVLEVTQQMHLLDFVSLRDVLLNLKRHLLYYLVLTKLFLTVFLYCSMHFKIYLRKYQVQFKTQQNYWIFTHFFALHCCTHHWECYFRVQSINTELWGYISDFNRQLLETRWIKIGMRS